MSKRKAILKHVSKADAALLAAIRKGDAKRVCAALSDGANPNAEDKHGTALAQATQFLHYGAAMATALADAGADLTSWRDGVCWAVYVGSAHLVRKLIASGANLDVGTPLAVAAQHGHAEIAEALIAAGANLDAEAPLVAAIKGGHTDIACALIEAGAHVNIGPVVSNVSPIAQATAMNDLRVLRALIKAGADVSRPSQAVFATKAPRDIKIISGAPLMLAARCGHADGARLLIEAGADPLRKDVDGLTPWECAMRYGHTAVAEALRAAGGDQRRDTPDEQLLAAAESGDTEELRRLISAGAAIEARDSRKSTSGRTPLMLAAGNGHVDAVSALLAAGADLNTTDEPSGWPASGFRPVLNMAGLEEVEKEFPMGRTALLFAAAGGHVDVLRTLISAGADVNAEDFAACTALYLAARSGHADAVSELLKSGAAVNARGPKRATALMAAVEAGSAETVRLLLSHGAKVNVKSREESTSLLLAAQQARAELLKMLIASSDFQADADMLGNAVTGLLFSNRHEDDVLATLEQLLTAGAAPDRKEKDGTTPLMTAAYKGLSRVVSRLIELGADVNAGGRKATPLHYSVVGQSLAAAKVLLDQGADVLAVNEQGKNVLEYARTFPFLKGKKREQFLQLLERYQDRPAKPGARYAKPEKPKKRGKESATKKKRNVARKREVVPLPEFSQAARNKKYVAALDELERLCGSKRQALDGLEGAFLFQVEVSRELDVVKLQRRLLIQGAYIVALDFSGPTNPPQRLLCFATTDKYKAVTAMQTAGPNHGLSTRGIIQWLRKTEKEQPLIFTNIGRDVVAGQFVTAIKNAEKLTQRMIEFCPGIEDAHDDLADFAKDLRKHRRFDFWWD